MYGNGRPRPITSGVSAGKTWLLEEVLELLALLGVAASGEMIRIPCSASAGRSSSLEAARRAASR